MRVLGVCGSPREGGNTMLLLEAALQEAGGERDMIDLAKADIRPCNGCMDCQKGRACPIEDGMRPLYPKLAAADIVLLATPTYFSAPSAQCKAFIDRCLPFYFDGRLRGKVGAALVVSAADGQEHCSAALRTFFDDVGMFYAGAVHGKGAEPRDVKRDLKGMREAGGLARKAVELAALVRR